MTTQNKKNITRLALLFTVCGVLLLAVAVGSLILRCRALEQRLDAAFLESLTAHTLESGESARELIENTQILLGDAVRLLEGDGRPLDAGWADPMLEMVNLGGHRLKVNYLDMEAMSAAEPGSEELRVFQQLQDGTNVVGGVIPTQEANDFYFLVVRAVEQKGEMVGAVRA